MTTFHTCAICGKKKRETTGYFWTLEYLRSLGVKFFFNTDPTLWEGRVYACDRCTKPLEKASTDWAKMMKIKEEYLKEKQANLKENQAKAKGDLARVLDDLAGWVRVKDICEAYNALGHHESSREMATILKQKGFTVERRTHGYAYIYVNIAK